jgi:wyosine [tRNA(Phe)-imidazoG37] synthetase (radical SAM superfamily)
MKYLFGPVNSRRLGLSLGVDLLPYKTCTLDCIYCECGDTTNLVRERAEYVSTDEVIRELDEYLSKNPQLDFVTFSGSGEPTMHTGIGRIIRFLKDRYPRYKVAVLTNSTLINDPAVRTEILPADVVVPSVDAVGGEAYRKVCRPCEGIDPAALIEGLAAFRREFTGKIIAEVFIVPGVNDSEEELSRIRDALLAFSPDAIQLNSIDRPGCVDWIRKPTEEEIQKIRGHLSGLIVQVVERKPADPASYSLHDEPMCAITALLERRPSTIDDICVTLGMRKGDAAKILSFMSAEKVIEQSMMGDDVFYSLTGRS